MKKLFVVMVVIGFPVVLVLGYFGFVPGVSSLFGSNKPRDLGVMATAADLQSALAKTGIQYSNLTSTAPESSFMFSGSRHLDASFTDKELTALMAEHEKMWKYYPVSDAQVRINSDGTAELSGILRTERIHEYTSATGMAAEQVKTLLDAVKVVVPDPPIYIKGKAGVQRGVLTTDFQKIEIGRLPVPTKLVTDYQRVIDKFSQGRLEAAGMSVQSASLGAGLANFKGNIPEVIGFAPN